MATFYKDNEEAGQEVRRSGQLGIQVPESYQPGQIYSSLRGRKYEPGQEAAEFVATHPAKPAVGVKRPVEPGSDEDLVNYLMTKSQPEPTASGSSDEDLIQYLMKNGHQVSEPTPAAKPDGEATYLGDLGRGVVRGGAGLVGGIYELGNLATMGGLDTATKKAFGTSGTEAFNNARTALNKQDSAAVQAQRAELEAADGLWSAAGTLLTNPKLMGAMAIEMVPQVLTVLGAAKTVATKTLASQIAKGATKEVAEKSAQKAATMTVMGVNPALEAGMAASDTRSAVMQLAEADLQKSPQYQALIAQGYSFEDARARLANDAATFAAAVTAPISLASNALTAGFEARLATGQVGKHFGLKALGKEVGEGLIKEPIQEGIEEGGSQFGQNVGLKYSGAKPNQDLLEGVPQAAGAGAALGVVAGAGFGAANAKFGLSKDPNAAVNPPAGGNVTGSTGAGTTPPGSTPGAGQNQAAGDSETGAKFVLSDEEFGQTMASPRITPVLAAMYYEAGNKQDIDPETGKPVIETANQPTMAQTQIIELARRYNPSVDQSYFTNLINDKPELVDEGFKILDTAPAGFVQAFRNSIPEQVAKVSQTPLPPGNDVPQDDGNFSDPDSADAAIASAEDLGIKPKTPTDATVIDQGGAPNVAPVPPADQGSQASTDAGASDVAAPQQSLYNGQELGRYDPQTKQVTMNMPAIEAKAQDTGLSVDDVKASVLLHEAGVHLGMEGLLGNDFMPVVNRIKILEAQNDPIALRAKERRDAAGKSNDNQEIVGYFVEEARLAEARGEITKMAKSLWDKIKAIIAKNAKSFLQSMGWKAETLTPEQILALARAAAFQSNATSIVTNETKTVSNATPTIENVPMYYSMKNEALRPDLRGQYPKGTSTLKLIQDGIRTSTTRRQFANVGDIITFAGDGNKYRVTDVRKPDLSTPEGRAAWEAAEGWSLDFIDADPKLKSQVYSPNAVQTTFEPVNKPAATPQQNVPKTGTEEIPVRYVAQDPDRNINPNAGQVGTYVSEKKTAPTPPDIIASDNMRKEELRREAVREAISAGQPVEQFILKIRGSKLKSFAKYQQAFKGTKPSDVRALYEAEVASRRQPSPPKEKERTPRQSQIGETADNAKALNKYETRANTIINQVFGQSRVAELVEKLDQTIRYLESKLDDLPSVSRSDVENIFGLLDDPRYRSLYEGQITIPNDEKTGKRPLTRETAEFIINKTRGAINGMTRKDAERRNESVRRNIQNINKMLAALRGEMTRAGVSENLIDDILLDRETGVRNIMKSADASITPDQEVALRERLLGLNLAEKKTKSKDPLAKPMSVDEIVNNAKLSADPEQYVRSILNRLGFEPDVVDQVVSSVQQENPDLEFDYTEEPENGDLFGENSIIAAQFVDALQSGEANDSRSLDTVLEEALAAGVGRVDILQELARRNLSIPPSQISLDGRPAFHYTLSGWMNLNINQERNPADVREDWLSSLDYILGATKDGPVKADKGGVGVDLETKEKIESGLTEEEKTLYKEWKKRRDDLRTRLNERMKKEGANTYLFDNLEDAFPHALFNKFSLAQMRNPESIKDPELVRALQYLTRGGLDTLPDLWFSDILKVMDTRRDLQDDLMATLDEGEYDAYQEWRNRQIRIEYMRAKQIAAMPEYKQLLQLQNDLTPEMYAEFAGQIVRAKQSERSAILQAAWELSEQKRAAEAAKANVNEAEEAAINAFYNQDDGAESVFVGVRQETEPAAVDEALANENAQESETSTTTENDVADPNANVEALVDLLRDKWTRFKTGRFSGVMTAIEIDNHLKNIVKNWKNAPPFEVLYDIDQLPPDLFKYVVARLGRQSPKAFVMPDGKVYLFAKYMENMADAEFTFFHETYGHYGLRGVLGDQMDAFLENQYRLNKQVREAADSIRAEAEASDRQMTQLEAIEEAVSDLAAENKEPGLFAQIMKAIQKFLRSVGMNQVADWMESKSQAELAFVLSQVRKAVRNGEISPLNGAPDSIRFNADPIPIEVFATNKNGRTSGYAVYNPFTHNWTVFFNPDGLDAKNFGIQVFDNYADALNLIKKQGKTIRVKNNPVRMDKMPGDFLKEPVPDFTDVKGIRKWVRMFMITVPNKYKPVQEVVDYLRSKGVDVDLDRYLKLYNGRIKPYFDRFRLDMLRPIAKSLNIINESGFTYKFRGNSGEDVDYGGSSLVGLYLTAKHARERNAEVRAKTMEDGKVTNDKGSGISDQEADTILKDLKSSPIYAELEAISAITQRLSKIKVNYGLMTGLISEYTAKSMNSAYQNYVNLSGNEDPDSFEFVDKDALGGQAFNVAGNDFKHTKGRGTISVDVLENTLNAYLSVIIRGQKNVVVQSLMRMVNNANDPRFGVINPITSAKKLNIEKLVEDKVFFAALSDSGAVQAGRDIFYDIKQKVDSSQMTPLEAATNLQQRLDDSMYQGRISSKQHEALSNRLQSAVEKNMKLGADGYMKEVSELVDRKAPGAFLVKVGGKPVVVLLRQGEDTAERFGTLASALKGSSRDQALVLQWIATANREIGQLLTSKNLPWVPINWFRDMGAAYGNLRADPRIDSELANKIIRYSPRAYRVAINQLMKGEYIEKNGRVYRFFKMIFKGDLSEREDSYWKEYNWSGSPTFFLDRKDIKEQLAEMEREFNPKKGLMGTWEAYGKFADFLGIPSEMSVRFSAYMHLREAGWTKDEAAIYAKELTVNFEQTGSSHWIRALFMFANPAIQGNIRMFKDVIVNGKLNPRFVATASALAALGMVANFIARAVDADDDDDDKPSSLDSIPRFKRATQVVLFPGMPMGAPLFVPYGWNVYYALGQFMPDSLFFDTPASTTAGRIASTAIDSFWPLGQSESASVWGTFVKSITPTPIAPVVDIAMNESRYGGPITKEDNPFVKAETAASWSNFSSSSPISAFMLRGLNELTGGNQYKSGWLDFNPDKLDYIAGAWLPGPIADTGRLLNTGINLSMGRDVKNIRLPLIDRFGSKDREDNPSWDAGAYRRAQTYVSTLYQEAQTEQGERKQQILKDHPGIGAAKAGLDAIDKNIRAIRTSLRAIENDKNKSMAEKVAARNHVEKLEQQYFDRAVGIAMKTGFKDPVLSDR